MRYKTKVGNQGFIKGLFMLALLAGVVYVGVSFGKPYYRYNTLRSHTKDMLLMETASLENIPRIKEKILKEAAEIGVPLGEDNLSLTMNGSSKIITVKATWSEVVNFMDYYSTRVNFEMTVEG